MRVLAALLLLLPVLFAQPRPAVRGKPARSWLHGAILDRSDTIVVARYDKDEILPIHEIQMTTFKVNQTLKGTPRTKVMIGGMGDRGSAFKDLDKILFLKPMKSGRIFELIDVVDLTGREEGVVERTIRTYLRLGRATNPLDRERALFGLSLTNLETSSVFATRTAIKELGRVARDTPFLFRGTHLDRIVAAGAKVPRSARYSHRILVRQVSKILGTHFRAAEQSFPEGGPREEFKRAVRSWRRTPESAERRQILDRMVSAGGRRMRLFCEAVMLDDAPEVRQRAAFYLGEFAASASRRALANDIDSAPPEELKLRIEALGKIAHPESLPIVLRFVPDRGALDATLLALARFGGIQAGNVLDRVERALSGKPGEEERVRRIRYYRSEAFTKAEAKRRLQAKKTWK